MDLESELRAAMAEHTAGTTAPPSLAAAVRRRHRRRVVRIRVTVGTAAAAAAAAFVVTPAYHSMTRVDSAGVHTTPAGSPASPDRSASPPAPGLPASPPSGDRPGAGSSKRPAARPTGPAMKGDGPDGGPARIRRVGWVTYLPPGLAAEQPCVEHDERGGRTTTCRWSGPPGWVEIRVVRGTGLSGPEDLYRGDPAVPQYTSVRGVRAAVTDRPDSGRQVAWMARPGVGAVVAAGGGSVRDQLMRIAEGVRL
ncbi:hypothetical protein Arub01_42020 [Actinomadura rubrobrunea]|uniref:DUF3515 domain-containing protein n=1 Tax=Actinomadura rubrobrunea TaxID=115335 RepID=A0A9W6UXC0_9ACTN|nr:hypothetical protein [Actinomadura rubrobrunea]GLW65958.1 hypothetical protein Arub01_42020 [Actinomadura rubrobrunea]